MPAFRYITRDSTGEARSGTMVANNVEALSAELRSRGMLVLEVEPVGGTGSGGSSWNPAYWLPATSFDVEMGCQQLATMLHSGMSLIASLRTVAEQARRPRAAAAWTAVAERIERGSSFADAMAGAGSVFTSHVVQLVRVGESSGNLDGALRSSAEHLERARHLRLTVLNALMYPAIVAFMAIGVTAFLVIGVIPKLQKYLGGRGRTLPAITQNLLDVVAWLQEWAVWLCLGGGVFLIALVCVYFWPPGRLALDTAALRIPMIGRTLRLAGTAIVARSLGVLIESGVTLLDSLRTVEGLMGNRALRRRVSEAREAVLRGGMLAPALSEGREFMPMLGRLVAVGESSGTMGPVLREVAQFHESQLVASIKRMSMLIEPAVILIVGGIVGFVYIAFFVALFSLTGAAR